jgi:hypothetical protein
VLSLSVWRSNKQLNPEQKMKSDVQKSPSVWRGLSSKILAAVVGAACYAAVLAPKSASAQEAYATQLKYLQLMVVLTGEAPWFPAGATSNDYIQWARNNGMRPTGGWDADAPITTDMMAETLVQLLGYNARKYNGDYYRTLAIHGINLQKMDIVTPEWITLFIDNPWEYTKNNPTSPKDPTDPKNPRPKDSKDDKGKGRGHNRR